MKVKIKQYFKEMLSFFVIIALSANILSWYRSQNLNKTALHLSSVTLIDGSKESLKRDRPLLIHFWATWCPVCKMEASNIETLSKEFQVVTVAVNSKSNADIQNYMQKHHYSFHVVNDAQSLLASRFKVAGFPTTFIYNKEGKLIFSEVGYTSLIGLYVRMWWAGLE